MKAKLEFDLDEPFERVDHIRCVKSLEIVLCFDKVLSEVRKMQEGGKISEEDTASIFNILDYENIDLEEYFS